ncbi:hypothetical protein A1D23_06615 [Chelonobacter oris]|uniref:Dam family site-specific DNA-(adenine-N6)-methyltransferase n=1 Tax=Chelonobacter oris TaxID=505317 RepID=UPI0024472AE1|nr:Dam family site-specific DNA-(adenine-N6)-methyltransferase [Chelonobacter oris]MDH2999764.1 hypothetical protein [Chelonobacter oris]
MNTIVKTNNRIIASPMNYIGGKAKLLPQLFPLFPSKIDNFYDPFTGGGNVAVNVVAEQVKANDINKYVIQILSDFQNLEIDYILNKIDEIIKTYQLTKENKEGFLRLRKDYNSNPNPIMLYTLLCYSFNYQFRFNNKHEYNNPFGASRSCFSSTLRDKLIRFIDKLKKQNIIFSIDEFENFLLNSKFNQDDFVYLDPPYLITTGSYNDGNRGFKDWSIKQEKKMYDLLHILNQQGVKWALSNVIEHKGESNVLLLDFAKNFNVHLLNHSYHNSSYNTSRTHSSEVLIVNY